jgi:hypothetical protein
LSSILRQSTVCLRGKVYEGENPVENASVYLFIGKPEPLRCSTKEDGSFTFEEVEPGSYFIRVVCAGYMVCNQDVVIPRSQGQLQDTIVSLKPASNELSGCVMNIDNRPVLTEVTLLQNGRVISTMRSEIKTGAFQFSYLCEGFFEVTASAPCYVGRSWRGNIAAGKNQIELTLTPVEDCAAPGICDVCESEKTVRYCKFCHAFICEDCRHNYPERVKAMLRARLSKNLKSEEELEAEFQKLQKDFEATRGKRCSGCH